MISWVAMDRILERHMATDADLREKAAGRPRRSLARPLTDEKLLAKLRAFSIALDRSSLEPLCRGALSAEEIAGPLMAKCVFATHENKLQGDWIWVCVDALWNRWFPDIPFFEMLDDKMQAGYESFNSGNPAAACRIWLDAWDAVRRLFDKADVHSISEFDSRFQGTQSLLNWIQDFELELWNAGLDDPQFLRARIAVCEEGLRWAEADGDDLLRENFQRAVADSYFELGETGKADDLYRTWLEADPQWGWGWIGWSDCYQSARSEFRDLSRSEYLLRQGLSVAGVEDFKDICVRLADLYKEQGRDDEANEVRRRAERRGAKIRQIVDISPDGNVAQFRTAGDFGEKGLPLNELPSLAAQLRASAVPVVGGGRKVGRNDPCPCGSGKKFKKCCAE
jgi:tetratricopeptide (TPR) repeat protein